MRRYNAFQMFLLTTWIDAFIVGWVWVGAWLFNPPISTGAVWFIAWVAMCVRGSDRLNSGNLR